MNPYKNYREHLYNEIRLIQFFVQPNPILLQRLSIKSQILLCAIKKSQLIERHLELNIHMKWSEI